MIRKPAISTKSCDICHRIKERCVFKEGDKLCIRCRRLDKSCSFKRPLSRIGRPGSVKDVPYGQTGIISLRSPPKREARESFPRTSPRQNRSGSRVIKDPPSLPILPPGYLAIASVLDNAEDFFITHGSYMIGPSFGKAFHYVVQWLFCFCKTQPNSHPVEGYLAFLGIMRRLHSSNFEISRHDLICGTKGLETLRNTPVEGLRQAVAIVGLGQALAVFDFLTTCTASHSILRGSLLSIRCWYPLLIQLPLLDPLTITPIMSDTVRCLVSREVPVIRFHHPDRIIIDRYVGLCCTLMPLLYELCVYSHTMKETGDVSLSTQLGDVYYEVEQKIKVWEPTLPDDFFESFNDQEAAAMMAQSRVYRLSGLLLIHRLRYSLGTEDGIGKSYAMDIINSLFYYVILHLNDAKVLPMMFPLFLAMLEVEGPGEKVLEHATRYAIQAAHAVHLRRIVNVVRESKREGFQGLWFSVVEDVEGCFVI